jgi:hypothetical protein
MRRQFSKCWVAAALLLTSLLMMTPALAQSEDASPPTEPVKLIFIHHSTGENWVTDDYGNLGRALDESNYFVSDTNYGWGPDSIGDNTDYHNWVDWFLGPESARYLDALYNESGQNSTYTRTQSDPGGENQIIMFKSCFPNSDLAGNPGDPASDGEWFTVGHAKYVYKRLLEFFITRPDKLFIIITPPPLIDDTHAANARQFSRWLVEDWLDENNYPYANVAVWDFHNVLTHPDNHHRFVDGSIEHTIDIGGGALYYDSDGDDHPNIPGSQKATQEFVPMLNVFYHRWVADTASAAAPVVNEQTASSDSEPPEPPVQSPSGIGVGSRIDDFEAGAPNGTYGWEAYWDEGMAGTTLSCGVDSSMANAGSSSLRIDFHIEPDSWGTCALSYDRPPGLASSSGLAFDYHAGAAELIFNIDAHGGNPDARTTYHYSVETVPESVDGWVHMELSWDQIVGVDWEANPGQPVDPAEIIGFAFGFNTYPDTPNSGTIWIDNFGLLNAGE